MVRYTLHGLLLSLVLPLPFLLVHQQATQWLPSTIGGIGLGWLVLFALMSQRVRVDAQAVQVEYASWVPSQLVQGWRLPWSELKTIESRVTGQGGRVHYFVDHQGERFLLPMRIAGFAQLLRYVTEYTGLDTTRVKPLAQPWMYLTLLACVGLMFLMDSWVVITALS